MFKIYEQVKDNCQDCIKENKHHIWSSEIIIINITPLPSNFCVAIGRAMHCKPPPLTIVLPVPEVLDWYSHFTIELLFYTHNSPTPLQLQIPEVITANIKHNNHLDITAIFLTVLQSYSITFCINHKQTPLLTGPNQGWCTIMLHYKVFWMIHILYSKQEPWTE